jgi:hypothetical protein
MLKGREEKYCRQENEEKLKGVVKTAERERKNG